MFAQTALPFYILNFEGYLFCQAKDFLTVNF